MTFNYNVPQDLIPLCVPEIRGNELKYLEDCLKSNFVSSVGPYVERFERELAEKLGLKFGVATMNGTAALHIALLVAGVRPDDEVLISTLTFIAPANAIRYAQAWPVFIDADPLYWQMDVNKLTDFIENKCTWNGSDLRNCSTGRRIKVILPVHILGHPVDIAPILDIARKYNLLVIEDATESLGGLYHGQNIGTLGDISCFSFNGNKTITTGGGGMLLTNRQDLARYAKYLTTQAKDDVVEFIHGEVGFNYRLSNLQAAVGCAQLELLDEYIELKRQIAERYREAFASIPGLTFMGEAPWARSVFWLSTMLVDSQAFGVSSRQILKALEEQNISSRPLWQPIHMSKPYLGSQASDCSTAERLYCDALSLPSSVGLTHEQQQRVISRLLHLQK